ncbi:cyclic peptide transporter [Rheinheimera sp. A13L]|uniref:cyclic peptide export ABC transporter n=1 Tax=Rheinheimera sp. A13L TaxID=506534 RepID=UPI00021248E8|nr:cyclic peptide export ABC transporter [Rheinheimera sp. A13L]EGM76576.1 cyclic peptide transporter [Rheinheimera sp. A13L]
MVIELIKRNKYKIIANSIIGAASAFFGLWLITLLADNSIESINADLSGWMIKFSLGLVCLFIVSNIANYFMTKLSIHIKSEVRSALVKRILNTPFNVLDKMGGHKVQASLTTDVSDISGGIATMPRYIYNFLTTVICLGFLAFKSLSLFLVLIVVLPLGLLVSALFINRAEEYDEKYREDYDELHKQFKSLVDGVKELNNNSNRKKAFYQNDVTPSLNEINSSDLKSEWFWNLTESWGQILLFLCLGSVIFAHSAFGLGESTDILSFIFILTFLLGPIDYLLSSQEDITKAMIAIRKLDKLAFSDEQCIDFESKEKSLPDNWSTISFRQASFHYEQEDNHFVSGPFNIDIHRGEVVIIKGGNGSGKSTFAKLLIGLYQIDSGTIQVNETKITPDLLIGYQNLFSVIHSDFYLFDSVINRNGELVSDDDIRKYLEKLQLSDKVQVENGKFSTTKLSHGQRKRLALLLAYLEDAPVYVFDEWAADQDPYFRRFFYEELLTELKNKGKTVIVISHDDKYFSVADRLVTFEEGNIDSIEYTRLNHIDATTTAASMSSSVSV